VLGWNVRMTEFQGAILLAQMERVEEQMKTREENASYLDQELAKIDGVAPLNRHPKATSHAHHLYIFRYFSDAFGGAPKAKFIEALSAEGVPCASGYVPLYKEQMFYVEPGGCPIGCGFYGRQIDYGKVHCPVCENASYNEVIWLGQSMLLGTKEDMDDIVAAVRKVRDNAAELG
jgi:dTDP-4-amino-4,6-dideoxygalactose transaminase